MTRFGAEHRTQNLPMLSGCTTCYATSLTLQQLYVTLIFNINVFCSDVVCLSFEPKTSLPTSGHTTFYSTIDTYVDFYILVFRFVSFFNRCVVFFYNFRCLAHTHINKAQPRWMHYNFIKKSGGQKNMHTKY